MGSKIRKVKPEPLTSRVRALVDQGRDVRLLASTGSIMIELGQLTFKDRCYWLRLRASKELIEEERPVKVIVI
jgi:hypothetical protein